jgi:hypothetical protein
VKSADTIRSTDSINLARSQKKQEKKFDEKKLKISAGGCRKKDTV